MRELALVNGKGVTLVDDDDYEMLARTPWYLKREADGRCYAVGFIGGWNRQVKMHRIITAAPRHLVVDHIDRDGLNNQRCNLRVCTVTQNNWNQCATIGSSAFRGVSYIASRRSPRKWRAALKADGRSILNRTFATEVEAARAYDEAAREHYGPFARLNFPRDGEQAA